MRRTKIICTLGPATESPEMIRQFSLRTGDTVEGVIREPGENERYFALVSVERINFEEPEKARHKVAFENLTPLYPNERLKMERDLLKKATVFFAKESK